MKEVTKMGTESKQTELPAPEQTSTSVNVGASMEVCTSDEIVEEAIDWHQKRMRKRIRLIAEELKIRKETEEEKFYSYVAAKYGIKRTTLKECLRVLEGLGVVTIKNGKIKSSGTPLKDAIGKL
jgi:ribosomal protein S25